MEDVRMTKESSDSSDDEASSSDHRAAAEELIPAVTTRDSLNQSAMDGNHVVSNNLSLSIPTLPEASIDALNLQQSLTISKDESDNSGDDSDVESEAESIKTTGTTTRSYISQADRRPPSPYDGIVRLPVDTSPIVKDDFRLLPEATLTKVGSVRNILENIVVIQAVDPKVFPTLDLHSVLFLNHTTPLGRVFDVFGNVDKPFYSLRFEAEEDIEKFEGLTIGTDVFAVPTDPQLTAYVFVNDLFKLKGTDAVGEDNLELPPELQDFSDDEKERQAKQEAQRRKRTHHHAAQALQGGERNGHGHPQGLNLPSPRGGGDHQRGRPSSQRGNGFQGPMVRPHQPARNTGPPQLAHNTGPPQLAHNTGPPQLAHNTGPPQLAHNTGPPQLAHNTGPHQPTHNTNPHQPAHNTNPHQPAHNANNMESSVISPSKVQPANPMLPSPNVNTSALVTFPTSLPSLTPAQPLNTDPKTLPSAEVLFYNPNTDATLAATKPKPSLFRNFMR